MKRKVLILSLFLSLLFTLLSCGNTAYNFSPIYVFDTTVDIIMYKNNNEYTLSKENADKLYNDIKKEINELSRLTNDFSSNDTNTSIYDLNKNRSIETNAKLIDIIKYSVNLIEDTDGYFNPFMGRLNHLWKDCINNNKIPSDEEIKKELDIIKNTSVKIEGNNVTIIGDGNIDLGGLVKGYALEWIRKYLNNNKVDKYIIDCGTSSIYIGDKEANVSITKPYKSGYIKKLNIKNLGVATSNGKYQNIVIDGVRYHHLINPFTGYPSNEYDSLSIIGSIDNGLMDAYSTAMFSMNSSKAIEFSKKKDIDLIYCIGDTIIHQKNHE